MGDRQRTLAGVRKRPCPLERRERWHRLLIVPGQGRAGVVLLSESVSGYDCHWIVTSPTEGYLTVCTGEDLCPCCQAGWAPTWYGYLACQEIPGGRHRLLAVPQACYANCDALRRHDGHLRGRQLWLQRAEGRKSAPLTAHLAAGDPQQVLPVAWDVDAEVLHRFCRTPISVYLPEGGAS